MFTDGRCKSNPLFFNELLQHPAVEAGGDAIRLGSDE